MTRLTAGAAIALVGALALAGPASAQESGRFRVLVPDLEAQGGADSGFGEDVADELRDLIDDMPTHAPVTEREVRDALRRFRIDADDLDCVRSRQLAVQLAAELVMCGSYDRGRNLTAAFIAARTGERFDVEPFAAARDRDAARHIFEQFRAYVDQLRQTAFCVEYVGSQQFSNALETCERAVAANPQSTTALYAVSRARLGLAEQKDETDAYILPEEERLALLTRALEGVEAVLDLNPMHQDALQTAGFIAAKMDRRDLARDFYRQYLELNPGAANVRVTIATDLANAGDPEGALDLILEGIELAGDAPDPLLLEYAGHFAMNAAAAAEEIAAAEGTGGAPVGAAGRSARELYDIAVQYYQRVYEERGAETDPAILRRMVQALVQTERADRATELAAQFVQTHAEDAGLWDVYANALNAAGRTADAIGALQRLAQLDPTARVNARQGLWLARDGEFGAARAAFERAVQAGEVTGDEAADAIFGVGYNQYYRQGRHESAMVAFEASRDLASSAARDARASFWMGYSLYQRAEAAERPGTVASARTALPMFERAVPLFQAGRSYAPEVGVNIEEVLAATRSYIERQQLIIRRGR
ncbi:MAG TPA: hypothetical protein VMN78_06660 [Longimicrobiales bacterium]|nr:hypothetical protein [Longimicrobiales bacterium]